MKKTIIAMAIVAVFAALTFALVEAVPEKYAGVDETVVEKYAEEAGRKARDPYINTDKGDLLLFFFLIAGVAGGFVGGYCFRELFPSEKQAQPMRKMSA